MSELLGGITLGGKYGGYELINEPIISRMPQALATGFYQAQEGFVGSSFDPIYLVGKQVVNGINYFVIAKQTLILAKPIKRIVGLIINIPPVNSEDKRARIVDVVTTEEPRIPEELKGKISEGLKGLVGATHKPVAFIGSQVVKGTDSYVVAESTPVVPNAEPKATLIIVNELEGKVSVKVEDLIKE